MKNNERIIEGLDLIIKGASIIREELSGVEKETPASKVVSRNTEKKEDTSNSTVAEEEPKQYTEVSAGKLSKEQLDAMKYNELKKLGASLGVPCTGKRDEITARILALNSDAEVASEPESEEGNNKVLPIDKSKKGLKKNKKEAQPEVAEEFIQKAKNIANETDEEDIVEALSDVGIKVTNNSDVVMLLAKALEEGLIDVDEEEAEVETEVETEEEPVEDEASEEDEERDFSPESYFEEYDPEGTNNPDNMSEERKEAVLTLMNSILEGIENDDITEEDIVTFCESFCTDDELESLGEEYKFEDLVALYCETRKRLIDDAGEEHEAGDPYEIAEENYCCGHKLKYDKKSKTFICEVCGEVYQAE